MPNNHHMFLVRDPKTPDLHGIHWGFPMVFRLGLQFFEVVVAKRLPGMDGWITDSVRRWRSSKIIEVLINSRQGKMIKMKEHDAEKFGMAKVSATYRLICTK